MALITDRSDRGEPVTSTKMTGMHTSDGNGAPARRATTGGTFLKAALLIAVLAIIAFVAYQVLAPKRSVLLFGDSITDMSKQVLTDSMSGDYDVTVNGVPGARSDQRLPEAASLAGSQPEAVVINLGTNDVIQQKPTDEVVRNIEQIGQAFPGACVAVVTVNPNMVNFDIPDLQQRIVDINRELVNVAATHDWQVVRWDEEVQRYELAGSPQGPLTIDTVHPTPLGQERLGELYTDALDGC